MPRQVLPGVITKGVAWIRGAFGLSDEQVPRQLDVDRAVIPTVDALQGGWGASTWDAWFGTQAAGGDPQYLNASDMTTQRIVTALSVRIVTGTAGETLGISLLAPGDSAPSLELYEGILAGGNEYFQWSDFGLAAILVPPGWRLRVGITTGPMTTLFMFVTACVGTFPAGTKPV